MNKLQHDKLQWTRAKVGAARTAIDQNATDQRHDQLEVDRANNKLDYTRGLLPGLNEQLMLAQSELAMAEEEAIEALRIEQSGRVLKLHAADPVGNHAEITAILKWLDRAVRQGLDTRAGATQHPFIREAMKLQPPRDDLNTPMYHLLGGMVNGATDWPTRRKALLAEAEHEASHSPIALSA